MSSQARANGLKELCEQLRDAANLRFVLLVGTEDRPFAYAGDEGFITELLARDELAGVLEDGPLQTALSKASYASKSDGDGWLYVQKVRGDALLVAGFDRDESSLGLVRLQVMKLEEPLARLLAEEPEPTLH